MVKPMGPAGPPGRAGIGQPFERGLVVAGGVGAEAEGVHACRQAGEGPLDEGQGLHARAHVPVPVLVGHHEILLDPVHRRGLVAAPALVVRARLALVALLDGGVVVQGRGGALPLGGHLMHQGRVDARQALEGDILGRDVGHLPGGPGRLGRRDQLLVVKGVEEVAERIGRGQLALHEAAEPAVGLEHGDVVETVPARGEEQNQGLELLGFRVPALSLADVHVLRDRLVQPEGAHRLQHQGQAGPAGQPGRVRDHFHRVREQAVAHRVARRCGVRPLGGALCRRARFTAVRSFTIAQSSS